MTDNQKKKIAQDFIAALSARNRNALPSHLSVETTSKCPQLIAGVLLDVITDTSGSNECHPGWIVLGQRF